MADNHPMNGAPRLAWERAVVATDMSLRAYKRNPNNVDYRETWQRARDAELRASRAYLAALQRTDPACSRCGCTMMDGCLPRCHWMSRDPWICSSHREVS